MSLVVVSAIKLFPVEMRHSGCCNTVLYVYVKWVFTEMFRKIGKYDVFVVLSVIVFMYIYVYGVNVEF